MRNIEKFALLLSFTIAGRAAYGQFIIPASGHINTVAGNGIEGFIDNTSATNAEVDQPTAVAVDPAGNLYINDQFNGRIRKVSVSTGNITTVAGKGPNHCSDICGTFSGDGGPATNAQLNVPSGIAVDATGNLYIVDSDDYRVRKVDTSGTITTVAGFGPSCQGISCNGQFGGFSGDGGPATSAALNLPIGVAVDASGNLYIADTGNNRIRKVTASTGLISTVAGGAASCFAGQSGCLATNARLSRPMGVAVDSAGNIYIADNGDDSLLKVTVSTGLISFVAAIGAPTDVKLDSAGNLFVTDTTNGRISKVTASTGLISTVAAGGLVCSGQTDTAGDGCLATDSTLFSPLGVALDSADNLYIADSRHNRIRAVGKVDDIPGVSDSCTINGTSVTCTATVTGVDSSVATGTITWTINGNTFSAVLSGGKASITETVSNLQNLVVLAEYSGDGNNDPSSGTTVIPSANTPTLPQWAAIGMGVMLMMISIVKMRNDQSGVAA
jgi:trimeric autotransporter adhesin